MWHVDNLKLSHKDSSVITYTIEALRREYANIMPLTVSRGRIHDYLDMVFDYSTEGEVLIQMYQYIEELINGAPERYKVGPGSATPAASHLFDVRDTEYEKVTKLTKEMREEYHRLTAQCLYLSKRARPDLQTSISFHCSRFLAPDEDNDLKLARTIRYLMATRHLPLILKIDDNGVTQWVG